MTKKKRTRKMRKEVKFLRTRIKELVENGLTYKDIAKISDLESPQAVYYHYKGYKSYPQGKLQFIKSKLK